MKKYAAALLILCIALVPAHPAQSIAPGIKLAPLMYEAQLQPGQPKQGTLDVSNPGDSDLHLVTEVQAFRQADDNGNLEFYPSEALAAAITLSSTDFILGPREAVRIAFSIDPNVLPKGGSYGAIFFRSIPATPAEGATQITTSARVGTLLLLNTGDGDTRRGKITRTSIPFFQFGTGIRGATGYANINKDEKALAFNPDLQVRLGFLGKSATVTGPLVFPARTRDIAFNRPGNYIGLLPVTISDRSGNAPSKTVWVLAVTGYWRFVAGLVLIAGVYVIYRRTWLPKKWVHIIAKK